MNGFKSLRDSDEIAASIVNSTKDTMLLNAKELEGYSLRASDGEIGTVKDTYFDDRQWKIRYAVVDTGNWLPGRKVLLSPSCFETPDIIGKTIPVTLSGEQIEASPSIETDKPITEAYEEALQTHYNWPHYWATPGYYTGIYGGLGAAAVPVGSTDAAVAGTTNPPPTAEEKTESLPPAKRHLQSVREVRGWDIKATDGKLGHVEGVLISPSPDWSIRQIVIDTRNWLPGRKVVVAPHWISHVDWKNKRIHVNLDRETIKDAPEYDDYKGIDSAFEAKLQAHYQSAPSLT